MGHNALRVPPLVMGYEFSGEIVAVGEDVTTLTEGQAVTVFPFTSCGECAYCAQGLNQLCVSRRLLGAHRPGAFAEYVAVPAAQVFALPPEMPLRLGALAEPVACGVRIGKPRFRGGLRHRGARWAGPILQIGNTNTCVRFGDMAPDEFGQAWTETGSTHHFALGVGHRLGKIEKLAKLLDIELSIISR